MAAVISLPQASRAIEVGFRSLKVEGKIDSHWTIKLCYFGNVILQNKSRKSPPTL
jgi:hypothetical protein